MTVTSIFPTSDDLNEELSHLQDSIAWTRPGMNSGGDLPLTPTSGKLPLRALRKWYQARGSYEPSQLGVRGFGK